MGLWQGHAVRASDLALLLTAHVAPGDVDDPHLAAGFLLHDVGKLVIPDAILAKRGPLSPEESAVVRTHPQEGWRMLNEIEYGSRTRDVVLYHHERWDGGGYPLGLSGEQIPLWARIFSVADTVDAMTSDRPYRRALPLRAALSEVRAQSGRQFDPRVVRALLRIDGAELWRHTFAAAARRLASAPVSGIGAAEAELVPVLR